MLLEALRSRGFEVEMKESGRLLVRHPELCGPVELVLLSMTPTVTLCHVILGDRDKVHHHTVTLTQPKDVDLLLANALGGVGLGQTLKKDIEVCEEIRRTCNGQWQQMCAVLQHILLPYQGTRIVCHAQHCSAQIQCHQQIVGTLVLIAGQVVVNLDMHRAVHNWRFTLNKYFPTGSMLEFIRMVQGGLCRYLLSESQEHEVWFGGLDGYLVLEVLSYLDVDSLLLVGLVSVDFHAASLSGILWRRHVVVTDFTHCAEWRTTYTVQHLKNKPKWPSTHIYYL
jgi:hypothetical protein